MFICLDLETTGLNAKKDEIIEVAIIKFDHDGIHEEWSELVNPGIPIPEFTQRLTGITNEMVKNARGIDALRETILKKVGDLPIMGHFIFFDINFLNHNGFDLKNIQLDTCQLAQAILPKEASYSLEVLVDKLKLSQPDAHRALDDVQANVQLLYRLGSHVKALSQKSKDALQPALEKTTWSWASMLKDWIGKEEVGKESMPALPIPQEEKRKSTSSEKHFNLNEPALTAPFLFEEATHTDLDLIDYAKEKAQDKQVLLIVPKPQNLANDEQIGLMKDPEFFLDPTRFNQWVSKENFSEDEGKLATKIILWLDQTKTGEKKELRLVKGEKDLWKDICSLDRSENPDQDPNSFYQKSQSEALKKNILAISHEHFLRIKSKKTPSTKLPETLIIGQSSQLLKSMEKAWHIQVGESRFLRDIHALKMENPEETEVWDSIASRIAILFGFLGMMLKEYGDHKDPRRNLNLEAHHRNTSKWNKVLQSASAIHASLGALGDHVESSPRRDEFERYLAYVNTLIQNTNSTLWMTLSRDEQVIVHSFPENPAELFEKRIWANHQLHLFDHHADTGNEAEFLREQLGLPEDLSFSSNQENQELPIEYPKGKIKNPNDPGQVPDCIKELTTQITDEDKDVFILVTSNKVGEQFFYKIKGLCEEKNRKLFVQNMSGGMGKIFKMSEKTLGRNIFIGQDRLLNNLIEEGRHFSLLAVQRFPFSRPGDPIQNARSKKAKNVYEEFSLPQAKLRLKHIQHTYLGNKWEGKRILILDSRRHLMG
jgi:DNA polymerase III epsilon subunit-like protein/Rad3-related DNA helicase